MILAFSVIALLLPSLSWQTDQLTCENILPASVDTSICDDIKSAVFIFRYAVRDIDVKVKETVLTSLNEAQKILDSTMATTIDDVRGFVKNRRKRSSEDMQSKVRALAEQTAKNIDAAIILAEKNIRSSIALAIVNTDIKNEKIKTEALSILHKVLNIAKGDELTRRGTAYAIQDALSQASEEVRNAMKEAVTTSIKEYKNVMDFFASRLKELFKKANFKGDVDQAEQDIEALAIKASLSFIQYYNETTSAAIIKAIQSVEGLLLKFNDIGNDNPYVLTVSKILIEAAGMHVSEVVDETNQVANEEVRKRIIADADEMLKDYQTIEGLFKKHGV
ncbi:uncharacterized protein LOC114525410 [Dendronephthya gigantea]|uniref:uncharacterized protein LOC114525410 n=1 Tax=Dendronephthya gigantea TaxID=151771 RepID=UPI001069B4C6|nr:uncharacterized protein LOC114525410 [Dendronephthya gigantea]